tara:strand:- start:3065 stop:3325 length:261 start_codon:yes stop_codon:yes gene_type:complete
MEVNELILQVKKKIEKNIIVQNIVITDKTFLHKKHLSHTIGKFHLELRIVSDELKELNKIDATKKIYKILDDEINKYIHSIKISIN